MVVLVTGGTGFLGSHVVKELLSRGYSVRATTRSLADADFLKEIPGELEIVEMDLLDSEQVAKAVEGCEDIIHCAAALPVGAKNAQRDIVDPSVIGTQNLVKAMKNVRCVVHTSSVAAIRSTVYENGKVFSSDDWCTDADVKSNPYGYAKAGAERIIRDWAADNGARLVTINPSIIFGPVLDKRHLKGSMGYLKHFVKGPPFVLNIHINFVDVRDVAIAHVNALDEGENGGRYLIHSGGMWMREIGQLLREKRPRKKWVIRRAPNFLAYMAAIFHPSLKLRDVRSNLNSWVDYDMKDALDVLGMELTPIDETVLDGIDSVNAQY